MILLTQTAYLGCTTCGPTQPEQHPRRPDVSRCSNCKEWLVIDQPTADKKRTASMKQHEVKVGDELIVCGQRFIVTEFSIEFGNPPVLRVESPSASLGVRG